MRFTEFLLLEEYKSPAERLARQDNKGDKLALGRIKDIVNKREAGLISDREAEQLFSKMTKSQERTRQK